MITITGNSADSIEIKEDGEAELNPDSYNSFVAALQLSGIELVKIQGERTQSGASSQSRFDLSAGYMLDGDAIHYRYDVNVHCLDDTGSVLGNVSASVLLVAMSVAAFDVACVEHFGGTSGALMAHPYLREAVASTAQRIGFPGVLLPMIRYQPDVSDSE
jgi:hypothetical protein